MMSVVNLTKTDLVTHPAELEKLAGLLLEEPVIAVDTESNSLYAYRERVCLIQFSTPEADFLVDSLALKDLSPLAPIFANPNQEKVFHAAEYDIFCLKRDYAFQFEELFDTMLAARILGMKAVGLGNLLESEFGVTVDKRYQRANWGQRPLPDHLLNYARLDTHYLIALRDRLGKELKKRQLWSLAQEDFLRLAKIEPEPSFNTKPPDCWHVRGVFDLNPQQAAILHELCQYRQGVAASADRPLFKIINDHTLVAIASEAPGSLKELSQIQGMTPKQIRRHGKQLLQAVHRGQRAAPLYPPKTERPSQQYLMRLDRLRNWRKKAAQDMGVPSDVVLPRDLMYSLAAQNPGDYPSLTTVMQDVPWRLERFGEQILVTLDKRK
jgi:ribonuclease D